MCCKTIIRIILIFLSHFLLNNKKLIKTSSMCKYVFFSFSFQIYRVWAIEPIVRDIKKSLEVAKPAAAQKCIAFFFCFAAHFFRLSKMQTLMYVWILLKG